MSKFSNFKEVHKYLRSLMDEEKSRRKAYNKDRIIKVLDLLGNPQDKFKSVHVAGTSGKTSTSYYASSLLCQAGFRVGLSVSPHIEEVNERVQINMQPLSEAAYCEMFSEFISIIEQFDIFLSRFEVFVAFAYWVFRKLDIEYAVIEVGLGGTLDGTNVIHREDKVCVITDIGYDHTHILGNTLEEITLQKAGIIMHGNQVFVNNQPDIILNMLSIVCEEVNATLRVQNPTPSYLDLPAFQARNFQLAEAVCNFILSRGGKAALGAGKIMSAGKTYIPGRMEIIKFHGRRIILDGAHNPQKLKALFTSLSKKYPDEDIACLVAYANRSESKIRGAMKTIVPHVSKLVLTSFILSSSGSQSYDIYKMADMCRENGFKNIELTEDLDNAMAKLVKSKQQLLVITGSLHLVQEVRSKIKK